jgi:membrane protease YdiL (CAAX protease family)
MTDAAAERSGPAREGLLARHPLVSFFIIVYAATWLVQLPLVSLSETGVGLLPFSSPLPPVAAIGIGVFLGPFLTAFIMTGVTEGRAGIGRLLRRIVLWRVGLRWYLVVLVGPPVLIALGAVVLPGALASFQLDLSWLPVVVIGTIVAFFLVGLLEETGWRGFALPRLQRQHGPLVGSLILGPLWGLWHLPLFLWPTWNTPPNFPPTFFDILFFVLTSIAMTIVYTWVFNNTKGSVFMVMWLHSSQNAFWTGALAVLFTAPLVTSYGLVLPVLVGFGAAALVIVVLTRGRLGYERYRQEAEEEPAPATTAPAR